MINLLNKFVWIVLNPASLGVLILIAAISLARFRKIFFFCALAALCWFYLWSTQLLVAFLGCSLEAPYLCDGRMPTAESYPQADAIVDFGGGVVGNTNVSEYAELVQAADRAYFSAKLWHAGKAPIVVPSCNGVDDADVKFLKDLGVPVSAIVPENKAVNTEENAKFVRQIVTERLGTGKTVKILLVTSAWHMRRSLLMMRKYASDVRVIPAPCDFEATQCCHKGFGKSWLYPMPGWFTVNAAYFHEWLGYWGYKLFR